MPSVVISSIFVSTAVLLLSPPLFPFLPLILVLYLRHHYYLRRSLLAMLQIRFRLIFFAILLYLLCRSVLGLAYLSLLVFLYLIFESTYRFLPFLLDLLSHLM